MLSSPTVANGYVYVGSYDNKIYQLNASNISQKIAEYETGHYVFSSPAVANGYVYVGSFDDNLYQFGTGSSLMGTDYNVANGSTANVTWSNLSEGLHQWYVVATDTGGLTNQSNIWNFIVDTTPPTFHDNSTNNTKAGQPTEFRINITDDAGVDCGRYSIDNCTGNFVNQSWDCSLTGTQVWFNRTYTINNTYGCQVRWKVYANDTSGNEGVSDEYSFTTLTCGVSMGFSLALAQGIDLGALNPTNDIQASPGNNGTGITNYSIQVQVSEGCIPNTVNLWTRVNQSLNTSDNSQSIPYDHYFFRYNTTNSTVPGSSHTSYDLTYQEVGSNLQDGDKSYLKFFINVSENTKPGTYNTYTFFKVNLTGS